MDVAARTGPPNRLARNVVVGILICLVIAGWVGDALLPRLVNEHPLLFMVLNSRNRNLVLVVNEVDAWAYYLYGTLRLLLSDPLFYLLGIWYGDAAIRWMERKSPSYGELMRTAEGWFAKAAYPLIFIAPNNFICLFAGAARMRPAVFLVLNVTGTIARLVLIAQVGELFSSPIDGLLDFIGEYRNPLLVVSVGLVAFTIWNERRHGKGELESLTHLDEEIADAEEDLAAEDESADDAPRARPAAEGEQRRR